MKVRLGMEMYAYGDSGEPIVCHLLARRLGFSLGRRRGIIRLAQFARIGLARTELEEINNQTK
jgi:hypothetical protein